MLQRKKPLFRRLLAFAWARNCLRIHHRSVQLKRDQANPERYQFTRNLKIFDGIRAVSVIYLCYGMTYMMAEYGIIQNPQYVEYVRKEFWFVFVTGGFYSVSILFFISGFLLTYSMLSTEFTAASVGKYYAKRIFKLMPYNIFILMFANFFAPTVGSGPHYANIEKALAGCTNYWWTNVLYINNIYPTNYEDKCLP